MNLSNRPEETDDVMRALPHAQGAEKAILSSMLQDPQEWIGAAVELGIRETHFYLPSHASLFKVLVGMFERGEMIEFISLVQTLNDKGQLDRIGGPGAITDIYTYAPSPGGFFHYAKTVKEKAMLRALIQNANESIADAYESPDEPEGVLDRAETRLMAIRDGSTVKVRQTTKQLMNEVIEELAGEIRGEEATYGISTGFSGIDQLIGGLKPGNMYVVAARPSMGKTSLMMNIVEHVCIDQKIPTAVFSLEMDAKKLLRRTSIGRAKFAMKRGVTPTKGDLQRIQRAAIEIGESHLEIDDTPAISISELRAKARRIHRDKGLGLIAIDYLQLMKALSKQAMGSREREIAEISAGTKALAKELGIPIIVLAQINRDVEKRTGKSLGVPRMSDLRESGAIEQDADMVGMLYRPSYYATDEDEKKHLEGLAKLSIAKNRDGETGEVRLSWIPELMRFEDAGPEQQEFADYTPNKKHEKRRI